MKERKRYKIDPVCCAPGDLFRVTIRMVDEYENIHCKEVFEEPIGRELKIDSIVTFDTEDTFGVNGIGCVIGREV